MSLIEEFLEMEHTLQLCHKQFRGYSYWIYHRFFLFDQAESMSVKRGQLHYGKKNDVFRLFGWTGRTFLHPAYTLESRIKKRDVLFISHPRRVIHNGVYQCIYTDRLRKMYASAQTLEYPYQLNHFRPADTEDLIYADRAVYRSLLRAKLFYRLHPNQYKKIFEEFCIELFPIIESMEKSLRIKLDFSSIARIVAHSYVYYTYQKREIARLLEKAAPKVIVEVVSYDPECMLINETAKDLGIPVIELQHGTIGRNHIAYNYIAQNQIRQFPNKIFTFSEYWNKTARFPLSKENIVAVGYPRFEEMRCSHGMRADRKYKVLFLSQGTTGMYLSKFALDIQKALGGSTDVRLVYKLHPGEYAKWRKLYPELAHSEIEVVDNNAVGLYDLFAESFAQVGVYSTAIYEGLGFGLKTFILNVYGANRMHELCDLGFATMTDDPGEVCAYIRKGNQSIQMPETQNFWKPNALDTMRRELNCYLI